MTPYEALLRESALRYRRPPMKARQISARKLICALLKRCENPYVAISGGKDSCVVLDFVMRIDPSIAVVYIDDVYPMPGTLEQIEALERYYDIHIDRVRILKNMAETKYNSNGAPVDYDVPSWGDLPVQFGYDGILLGLRSEESSQRHFAMRQPLRDVKYDGLWHCNPIHNWTYREVWAYMAGRGMPIHSAYALQINQGVDVRNARVASIYAACEKAQAVGAVTVVKRLWPDVWNQFIRDNPQFADE